MVEIFDNSAISSVNGPPMTIRVSLGCYSRMEMQVAKREAKGGGPHTHASEVVTRERAAASGRCGRGKGRHVAA